MRTHNIRLGFLAVVLLSTASPGDVHGEEDGGRLFAVNCAACHGYRGDGGIGVPLALPDFLSSVTDRYLFKTIRLGRPGRIMPAFEHLSDEQTHAIVRHIRSWGSGPVRLAPEGAPGDPEKGRDIFARNCARCHGPQGEGGAGTGLNFTRLHDQPVVAPALNNPGFLAAASDRIIRTAVLKGRRGTPMQPAAKMGLRTRDVDDLVSYIRSFEKNHPETAEQKTSGAAPPSLIAISGAPFAETVEKVKQAITARLQRIIREHPFDDGLVPLGEETGNHMVVHFGNIRHINTLLAIDPRMGLFLPNRITISEHSNGKVIVSAVNPLRFSNLFNNANLEHTSRELYELYADILEEITE